MIAPAAKNELPVTAPPAVLWERKPRKLWREDEQAEDRQHDARRAGDHLDRRLHRARQPRRAAVLAQPRRQRHADRARRSRCRPPSGSTCPRSDRESPRPGSGCSERGGRLHEQAGAQVGDPLDQHEQDDRRRDQAQRDPGRPAQPVADAIDQRPGGGALSRRRTAADRRRGAARGRLAVRRPLAIRRGSRSASAAAWRPSRRTTAAPPRRAARPPSHTACGHRADRRAPRIPGRSSPPAAAPARTGT